MSYHGHMLGTFFITPVTAQRTSLIVTCGYKQCVVRSCAYYFMYSLLTHTLIFKHFQDIEVRYENSLRMLAHLSRELRSLRFCRTRAHASCAPRSSNKRDCRYQANGLMLLGLQFNWFPMWVLRYGFAS